MFKETFTAGRFKQFISVQREVTVMMDYKKNEICLAAILTLDP